MSIYMLTKEGHIFLYDIAWQLVLVEVDVMGTLEPIAMETLDNIMRMEKNNEIFYVGEL